MKRNILILLCSIIGCYFLITFNAGCAQISAPTGGATDSLPPKLARATPELNTVNFKGNKVSLVFNEYIEVQDVQSNVIISPVQKTTPTISYNLKTVSIKFKDTLLPNTTYSVNFGNSIKDVHEGNILKNFTYVFSTGNTIDSLTMQGNVLIAESGLPDSTLMVFLYRNKADSAVQKTKPDYMAKLDGKGNFEFKYLPPAEFNIYALKDGDGGKTYNSKTEIFAFDDSVVNSIENNKAIVLYAYAEQKADNNKSTTVLKTPADKKLKYSTSLQANKQDILQNIDLEFNNPLKKFDSSMLILADTNYKPIGNFTVKIDSTRKKVSIKTTWAPETNYVFIIPKETATDSVGNVLSKSDTIHFKTKATADYGRLVIRFSNIDLTKHPVIEFLDGENLKLSFPITANEWSNKLFPPGDYTVRILYDLNNNAVWDPGSYTKKLQPEKATQLSQKIAVKADWDNERDIKL